MLNAKDATIDGIKFTVGQLPYFRAQRLMPRIGKALGPALAQGFKALQGNGGTGDLEDLATAIGLLFEHLTPDEFEGIQRELFSAVMVDGQPLEKAADIVLAGKPMTGLKVVAAALEVNFGNFSGVAKQWGARAAAVMAKAQEKPPVESPSVSQST